VDDSLPSMVEAVVQRLNSGHKRLEVALLETLASALFYNPIKTLQVIMTMTITHALRTHRPGPPIVLINPIKTLQTGDPLRDHHEPANITSISRSMLRTPLAGPCYRPFACRTLLSRGPRRWS
jgi:hypothetical protein